MINPKYKNVFMAPRYPAILPPADDPEPLVVNGHTINSKLRGTGRTIAETLRRGFNSDGQTIGSALSEFKKPSDPEQTSPVPNPIEPGGSNTK